MSRASPARRASVLSTRLLGHDPDVAREAPGEWIDSLALWNPAARPRGGIVTAELTLVPSRRDRRAAERARAARGHRLRTVDADGRGGTDSGAGARCSSRDGAGRCAEACPRPGRGRSRLRGLSVARRSRRSARGPSRSCVATLRSASPASTLSARDSATDSSRRGFLPTASSISPISTPANAIPDSPRWRTRPTSVTATPIRSRPGTSGAWRQSRLADGAGGRPPGRRHRDEVGTGGRGRRALDHRTAGRGAARRFPVAARFGSTSTIARAIIACGRDSPSTRGTRQSRGGIRMGATRGSVDPDTRPGLIEHPVLTAPAHRYVAAGEGRPGPRALRSRRSSSTNGPTDRDLLVTLMRSVGELSRADLAERPGHAGWPEAIPGAQEHGIHRIDLAIAPISADDGATRGAGAGAGRTRFSRCRRAGIATSPASRIVGPPLPSRAMDS